MFIGQPSPACRHHDQQNCLLGNHRLCLDLLRGLYRSRHELNGLKNKQDLKFLFRHYGTIQRTNRQLGFTFDSQNAFYFAIVVSVFTVILISWCILFSKVLLIKMQIRTLDVVFQLFHSKAKYLRYICT